jgi:hypothetical protein
MPYLAIYVFVSQALLYPEFMRPKQCISHLPMRTTLPVALISFSLKTMSAMSILDNVYKISTTDIFPYDIPIAKWLQTMITWSCQILDVRLKCFTSVVTSHLYMTDKIKPKRDEVTGEWRKLHNVELHKLYSSPDIVRQIKSRRMSSVGHVARMREGREKCTGFWC